MLSEGYIKLIGKDYHEKVYVSNNYHEKIPVVGNSDENLSNRFKKNL